MPYPRSGQQDLHMAGTASDRDASVAAYCDCCQFADLYIVGSVLFPGRGIPTAEFIFVIDGKKRLAIGRKRETFEMLLAHLPCRDLSSGGDVPYVKCGACFRRKMHP